MIFYYKAVGCKSRKTLVTGRKSDCVRFVNKKANKLVGNAHAEPIKIMPIDEDLLSDLSECERRAKELFDRSIEEELVEIKKSRSHEGMPKILWTEAEDSLLCNCKTFKEAERIGKVLGKTTAAVWARVKRIRNKEG